MDSAEVGKYIESVAVRIGFHDGGSLAGTGVLYTLQTQNRAVVLSWLIQATIKQLIFTIVRVL